MPGPGLVAVASPTTRYLLLHHDPTMAIRPPADPGPPRIEEPTLRTVISRSRRHPGRRPVSRVGVAVDR